MQVSDSSPINGSSTEQAPAEVARSDLWFEDGSVIIQAESTQFRVHRGILALHSTVFKDMFALPQPEHELLVEGSPIVHVSDSAKDWDVVLNILYKPRGAYKSNGPLSLELALPMLRLGHKYDFEDLKNDSLERFALAFPDTLEGWDSLDWSLHHSGIHDRYFDIIEAALEIGLQSILPLAFFSCLHSSYYGAEQIMRGYVQQDGSRSHLSYDSQIRLITGRDALRQDMLHHEYNWLVGHCEEQPSPLCGSPKACKKGKYKILWETFDTINDAPESALDEDSILIDHVDRVKGQFCGECEDEVARLYSEGRQKIWNRLPSYFGLPDWKDLQDLTK